MQTRFSTFLASCSVVGLLATTVAIHPSSARAATGVAAGASAVAAAPAPAASAAHQRWGLLVGVGENINPDNTLMGPKNDVPAVRDLLRGGYGFTSDHLKVLTDAQATHAAILSGWEWLIKNAKPGDMVVFYYSGHGIDIPDPTKPTGRDSALCPYDATHRADLIAGSQIGALIDRLKTDQVVVIVDACNSGSATRDLRMRRRSPNPASFGISSLPPLAAASPAAAPFAGQTRANAHKERYIGAARMDQSAMDYPFLDTGDAHSASIENPNMGALTYFLLQELRADPARRMTYDELVHRVRRDLAATFGGEAQEPQESGPGMDSTPFLALPTAAGAARDAAAARKSLLPIAVPTGMQRSGKGSTITLRSLAGATLTPGSVLQTTGGRRWNEIDDAQSARDTQETQSEAPTTAPLPAADTGLVRITSVNGTTATGVVLSGAVPTGAPLAEVLSPAPDDKLRVAVAVDGDAGTRLTSALANVEHVSVVPSARPSDVTLYPSATLQGGIDPYRGGIALAPVTEDQVPGLLANLQAVKQLADLESPSDSGNGTTPIHVRVQNSEGKEGYVESKIGAKAGFTITVDQMAYITLVDLAPDGSITGATLPRQLPANVPFALPPQDVKGPAGLDTIKIIATTFRPTIPLPASADEAAQMSKDGKPAAVIARLVLNALRTQVNQHAGSKGLSFGNIMPDESSSTTTGPGIGTATSSLTAAPMATDGWAVTDLLLRIEPAE